MKRPYLNHLLISLILVLSVVLGAGCELIPEADTQPSSDSQAPPLPSFVAVVEKVKPSVVAIDVEFGGNGTLSTGAGSGWIFDESGLIVTNSHVVHGTSAIVVTLDDGRTFAATLVGADTRSDLAVIKIDARNLPTVDIGDSSKLKVGEPVAAIGNALGLGISMKGGWVSRLGASVTFDDGQTLYGLIETDAAINPGNSGGPLINMSGEVIGITSAKLVEVDVEGIGYAISINSALPMIDDLINLGYIIRPFLGVSGLLTVTPSVAEYFGLGVNKGVLVRGVVSDSGAAEAGLKPEDVIVSIDGKETNTVEDLIRAIHSKEISQEIKITYWRGNTEKTIYAILTETLPPT